VRTYAPSDEPNVDVLLDVDHEYRKKAAGKELPQIAPRRFNPSGEAWLPVLHTRRGPWEFTALYSNTALAHQLGRIKDWVVIYIRAAGHGEMQRTIVTEHRAPLAGRRVVRGRESECRRFYSEAAPQSNSRSAAVETG
jgi:putative hydrolase